MGPVSSFPHPVSSLLRPGLFTA